jgi:hypothetical protein
MPEGVYMYETIEEWVETELCPLILGEALTAQIRDMELEEVVRSWIIVAYADNAISKRKEALRKRLLEEVSEFGKMNQKGGSYLVVEDTKITREKRVASMPDADGLKALLETANIPLDKVFTKVTKTVLDGSKITNLVNLGKLKGEDVERLKKITWALRVNTSDDTERLIESMLEDEESIDTRRAPRPKRQRAIGRRKKG